MIINYQNILSKYLTINAQASPYQPQPTPPILSYAYWSYIKAHYTVAEYTANCLSIK